MLRTKLTIWLSSMAVISILFLISCQKEIKDNIGTNPGPTPVPADLTTRVTTAVVSGFVTDENNDPISGASVKVGTVASTTTDEFGYFEVRNAEVIKNAAVVTVSQPGYFKGIKTFIGEQGKSAFFRIKLIPKANAGTVSGSSGGDVTLANGLKISFPANGVMVDGSGAPYSGTVNVAAYWIDPTGADLPLEMPGDLRALNTNNELRVLRTYGMAAVELTGSSGELLQVATGKKATITMPVPSSLLASAPSSIPLWHMDETKGLWVEEGSATKTGNAFVGEVSHFSFWNCDLPSVYVQINLTVVDGNNNPVPNSWVRITSQNVFPGIATFGITDSSGYVSGAVPANDQLEVDIYSNLQCGSSAYTQQVSTGTSNVSLGNIVLGNSNIPVSNINGTVTNCSNAPVSNGCVLMMLNNNYYRSNLNSNGSFSFNALLCGGTSATTSITAIDFSAAQQSPALTVTLTPGNNNVGNLQACGAVSQEFITYTIDTLNYQYNTPLDAVTMSGAGGVGPIGLISGVSSSTSNSCNISIDFTGAALGSQQIINYFSAVQWPTLVPQNAGTMVNITEYGPVGGYIAGNFNGVFVTQTSPTNTFNINFSFRVRRAF